MSERVNLLSVSYHSDDDTGMYRVGEIDFGVSGTLETYLDSYGQKGCGEILSALSHLTHSVIEANRKVNFPKTLGKDAQSCEKPKKY